MTFQIINSGLESAELVKESFYRDTLLYRAFQYPKCVISNGKLYIDINTLEDLKLFNDFISKDIKNYKLNIDFCNNTIHIND